MDFRRRSALNDLFRSLKCKPTRNARQLILNLIRKLTLRFRRQPAIPVGNQPPGWSILVERSCRAVRRSPVAQEKNSAVKYQRTLFEPEHELFRESYRAFLDRRRAVPRPVGEGQDRRPRRLAGGQTSRASWVWPCPRSTAGAATRLPLQHDRRRGDRGPPLQRVGLLAAQRRRRPLPAPSDHRGAEAALAAPVLQRRDDHRDRHDRTSTGSDLQGHQDRAVKEGDHYILNGSKTFITTGSTRTW